VTTFFEFASLLSQFGSDSEDIQEAPLSTTDHVVARSFLLTARSVVKYDDIESLIEKMVVLLSTTYVIVNE
jgi:hypothetical protein